MLTTLLELVGFTTISFGLWLAWPPLGFVAAGAFLVLIAYLADRGAAE